MLVIVKNEYLDKECNNALRKKGQILDIADKKRANALIKLGYVQKCKIIKVEKKTEDKISLDEIKDETVDVGSITKKEIKELLDKEGIEYKSSSTKDELLDLLPF